jgi:hypothetical protein
MSEKLSPDAATVCALLEIEADELADLFRWGAASALRKAADRAVSGGSVEALSPYLDDARCLLLLVDAFEDEWAATHPEDEDAASTGGTEATPPPPVPPQSDDKPTEVLRWPGDRK